MKRIELGCAGHFICASKCAFRRHTQVGRYRISTVGDMWVDGKRQTLGAGDRTFFETYVFKTTGKQVPDNEGCGCMQVADWSEIDGKRYTTAGEAQRGHESYVNKYARKKK